MYRQVVELPNFCPECGNELISKNAEICPRCGVRLKTNPEKSPVIAALCSIIFTGLGQVYNGYIGRGFVILLGTFIGSLLFVIPGLLVAIYGIYDAYKTAKRMNARDPVPGDKRPPHDPLRGPLGLRRRCALLPGRNRGRARLRGDRSGLLTATLTFFTGLQAGGILTSLLRRIYRCRLHDHSADALSAWPCFYIS